MTFDGVDLVRAGSNRSLGTDGRLTGSRSAPQPGMHARNSLLEGGAFGFSRCMAWASSVRSLCGADDNDRFDAVIEFGGEDVVALRDVFERDAALEVLHRRADFVDNADELVTEVIPTRVSGIMP